MRTSAKRLLTTLALAAAAVCAAPTEAQRGDEGGKRTGRTRVRVAELFTVEAFDVERRNGEIVGMTAVMKKGEQLPLKQQTNPTCATACPAGQKQTCWEDYEEQMSICACVPSGGGGGGGGGGGRFGIGMGKISLQDFH